MVEVVTSEEENEEKVDLEHVSHWLDEDVIMPEIKLRLKKKKEDKK